MTHIQRIVTLRSSLCLGLLALLACAHDDGISPIPSQWLPTDSIVRAAVSASSVPGLGLAIYDANDNLVFRRMYGDFTADRRVAVASASKLVSGLVLFELIDQGLLSLESTTADVLGWGGEPRMITLRHLLSFTSGLQHEDPCTASPTITLAACVEVVRGIAMEAGLGSEFHYGSTHLHVAARMAEVATGKTWNQIFREMLGDPLGLPTGVRYFTAPRLAIGTTNPLVAGGLRASMNDYAKLLALVFHRGTHARLAIGNPSLFAQQAVEPFPEAIIGSSPMANVGRDFHYGLTAWLECATPETGCSTISSPGAFGWTPWIDRAAGYYAIIGTELAGVDGGVVGFSVDLQQALKPSIVAALAAVP